MNIVKKVLILLIIFMLFYTVISNISSCYAIDGSTATSLFGGKDMGSEDSAKKATKIIGIVLDVVRVAMVGVGMVMLTVLGAKYMLASPNERADIKQHLVVYVVGAFIMFGASALVGIVRTFTASNVKA